MYHKFNHHIHDIQHVFILICSHKRLPHLSVLNLMFVGSYIIARFIMKNSSRCNNISRFYYSTFIWSSTCFGRHTAYHQEPKIALAASGFLYVKGCWTCRWWTLSGLTRPTTFHVWKTRGCQCNFKPLMMGGVLPETCWASYKCGIIKPFTLLYLVGFFFMKCLCYFCH
jgi:hypothetical protein